MSAEPRVFELLQPPDLRDDLTVSGEGFISYEAGIENNRVIGTSHTIG